MSDKIECPHCGHGNRFDSCDFNEDGETIDRQCDSCEDVFYITMSVIIRFNARKGPSK